MRDLYYPGKQNDSPTALEEGTISALSLQADYHTNIIERSSGAKAVAVSASVLKMCENMTDLWENRLLIAIK